jgi:alanine racemase
MTHFPSADDADDPDGAAFALRQVGALVEFGRTLRGMGVERPVLHAANSAGVALVPSSHLDMVRPGGALYGVFTGPRARDRLPAEPALSWRARVSQVREFPAGATVGYGRAFVAPRRMTIATVAAGYGDGYARAYGPGGAVLVRGARAPIVGRVSMDSMTVDVTGVARETGVVSPGEEVALIGSSHGPGGRNDSIRAEDLAALASCSPYEVICRITARVPRLYVETR